MKCSKVAYASQELAVTELAKLKIKRPKLQRAYHCPACKCWHLTSMKVGQLEVAKNRRIENIASDFEAKLEKVKRRKRLRKRLNNGETH